MKRVGILLGLLVLGFCFEIEQTVSVPRTHIGNDSIACEPNTRPQITNGFATWFEDNVYAC
jgi:hypothetical protein